MSIEFEKQKAMAYLRERAKIKRVIPLEEVAAHKYYWDMAQLAVIFNHDIVEMEDGVWRWRQNRLMRLIDDYCPVYLPAGDYNRDSKAVRGGLDLNTLIMDVHTGFCSVEEYMKFYMQIGYSLSGYGEVFSQSEAEEWNLPGAKTEWEEGQDRDYYKETPLEYMLRVHKGEVLKI